MLKLFYDGCFKILINNSNIWFISVLASADSFLNQVVIFLVFDVMGDFSLYSRHFGYYIWRLKVLFKSFIRQSSHLGLAFSETLWCYFDQLGLFGAAQDPTVPAGSTWGDGGVSLGMASQCLRWGWGEEFFCQWEQTYFLALAVLWSSFPHSFPHIAGKENTSQVGLFCGRILFAGAASCLLSLTGRRES